MAKAAASVGFEGDRLTKLETSHVLLENKVSGIQQDVGQILADGSAFRQEWRRQKEEETNLAKARQITLPQMVTMVVACVTGGAAVVGGILSLMRSEASSVRQELTGTANALRLEIQGQTAQTALQLRGQQDNITAGQTGLQSLQHDMGAMSVKLGLVEQLSAQNNEFLKQVQNYDAQLARQDEKHRALQDWVRAIAEQMRRNALPPAALPR